MSSAQEGHGLRRKVCLAKMESDLALLTVNIASLDILRASLQMKMTALGRRKILSRDIEKSNLRSGSVVPENWEGNWGLLEENR